MSTFKEVFESGKVLLVDERNAATPGEITEMLKPPSERKRIDCDGCGRSMMSFMNTGYCFGCAADEVDWV